MSQPNLFLFTGEDTYTAQQRLKLWRKEFEKKYGEFNVQFFQVNKKDDLTPGEFRNAINTLPFLSEKKLIIISDYLATGSTEEQQEIAEQLDTLPEHCLLVFIESKKPDARTTLYKRLTKNGQIKGFPHLEPGELSTWIRQEMQKKNASIGHREADLLAEMVGPDLWQMAQELEKLTIYSNGSPITAKTIEKIVDPNITASIFKLTDAIAAKNTKQAIAILKAMVRGGEDLFQIFYMIARQFRILLQVKSCMDKKMTSQKIIVQLKEKPFTVTNSMNQCKNFDLNKLKTAYRKVLNIDISIKSGGIKTTTDDQSEFRLALEKLIIELAH